MSSARPRWGPPTAKPASDFQAETPENPRLQSGERIFMLTLHIFPVLTFVWFAPLHEST